MKSEEITANTDEILKDNEIYIENAISHPEKFATAEFIKKFILLSPLIIALFAIAHYSPLSEYLRQIPLISEKVRQTGIFAPLVFIFAASVLIALGMPRLIFCPIAGMVFGFIMGTLWAVIATVIAYYMVFLFIRRTRRELFKKTQVSRSSRVNLIMTRSGIPGVIIARQLPIHGMAINAILSLSGISHKNYLIGTAIGIIPETIPAVLIGTSAAQESLARSAVYIAAGVVILAILWLAILIYNKKQKK